MARSAPNPRPALLNPSVPGCGGQREAYWSVFFLSLPPRGRWGDRLRDVKWLVRVHTFSELRGIQTEVEGCGVVAGGAARTFLKAAEKGSAGQDPRPLLSAGSPDERHPPFTVPTWRPLLAPHALSPPGVTHWLHPPCGLVSQLVAACS